MVDIYFSKQVMRGVFFALNHNDHPSQRSFTIFQ